MEYIKGEIDIHVLYKTKKHNMQFIVAKYQIFEIDLKEVLNTIISHNAGIKEVQEIIKMIEELSENE